MRKHIVAYEVAEVVTVPFPFTDKAQSKHRPALILSTSTFNNSHKHLILAMITSASNASWASDVAIKDKESAGLPSPSVVRMKLFTLDERLISRALGKLSKLDRSAVAKQLHKAIAM